ncbi:major facilitator superfamily domain-containing protein [Emericellopsis atlantica]|uniref:Major facilitator superfamily domain-containing protein n=1 Tax=Emericellopsis atlantica TaxID=2614577 RepID=A0A9P8CMQ0_9HYPO|nr:major facilitator superfamily domain-containing protein [Emericellopsis atlantica]KAG9252929.1 major facilitator superfamily domain-containing protein [Emericellopsis atlantica]
MKSIQQEQLQTADQRAPVVDANVSVGEKNGFQQTTLGTPSDQDSEAEDKDFQQGVRRVRAITSVWSKKTLVSMFVMLYLISFVDTIFNYVDSALNPYITSSFGSHGLLNIGSILATILGGCLPLPLAKIIDIWGRVEGFCIMMTICICGMALKATCNSVQMYIGGHILYWTGHIGTIYVITVMLADMTTLTNRAIIYGIQQTPRIVATFVSPRIADAFYTHVNFRWAYGSFIIILATCSVPAMGNMVYMFKSATKKGIIERKQSGMPLLESIRFYIVQFDLFGILLLCGALSCLLLPYSLAAYAPNYWSTPYIIAMEVVGVVLIPCFYVWEAKFAPVQFLPFEYLKQGTIIGSSILSGIMYLSTFTWNAYFGSYLQVVNRQSISNANYILNAYSLTSSVFAPLIGWFISYTGNMKWTAYVGVPIMLLGTALIIPLREPDTNPGVLAFTQILVGFGAGIFATTAQIAVMAPVSHQYLAVTTALQGLFGGVGSSIGYAIAGALWNNVLPKQLYNRLPESSKGDAATIFGDIVLQMSFADGTPEREAIVGAYAHVMRLMVIAGACTMPLCLLAIFIWRNINIRKLEEEKGKQTRGMVF